MGDGTLQVGCITDISEIFSVSVYLFTVSLKFRVLLGVAPCSHVEVGQRQRCVLTQSQGQFIALMMKAVYTSETSAHFNVTTWHYIPEDSKLHTHCHENLKSHILYRYFVFS
jgi:hypothetical protein